MSCYGYDLRIRVINAIDTGMKIANVSKTFKVSRYTIYQWIKLKKNTGDIKPRIKYQKGHSYKILDLVKLKKFIEQHYDKTLKELVYLWDEKISKTTIFRYIKRLGYTYKKNFLSSEKGRWVKREVHRNYKQHTRRAISIY